MAIGKPVAPRVVPPKPRPVSVPPQKVTGHGTSSSSGATAAVASTRQADAETQRFTFKVLCPSALSAILAEDGDGSKEWIAEQSSSELTFSPDGDCFPNTNYQVLSIEGSEKWQICVALGLVVAKLVQCGDEERSQGGPPFSKTGCLGKEPGEYVFRSCLLESLAIALIGKHGKRIQQLRQDTGAKVFVENDVEAGEQMLRVIGSQDIITRCLPKIVDFVWMETARLTQEGILPAATVAAAVYSDEGDVAPKLESADRPLLRPKIRGFTQLTDSHDVDERIDDFALNCLGALPRGTASSQYSWSCEVKEDFYNAFVSGHLNDFIEEVRARTGAELVPSEDCFGITIEAALLNLYVALHMIQEKAFELEDEQDASKNEGEEEVSKRMLEQMISEQEQKRRKPMPDLQRRGAAANDTAEHGDANMLGAVKMEDTTGEAMEDRQASAHELEGELPAQAPEGEPPEEEDDADGPSEEELKAQMALIQAQLEKKKRRASRT